MHHGDCLQVLRTMSEASVDSIVTDPPYGLSFMGRKWDYDLPEQAVWEEALRVAKPGAHLLAFGGTRTFHRLAVSIEDAGWDIRDCVMWVYGSGFPKSHNLKGEWSGWGTALKPAWEPILVARKPLDGTVAENVLRYGTGALNIDGCRVGTETIVYPNGCGGGKNKVNRMMGGNTVNDERFRKKPWIATGRWPANLVHDGSQEVLALFPDANFGSAARFFYCAKATKRDRDEGCDDLAGNSIGAKGNGLARSCAICCSSVLDGCDCPNRTFENPVRKNHHPTVKPTDLMRYLCRLVTPPGGVVLDPFMGSGSTGKAAIMEGFRFIGIEREQEYLDIARARIEAVRK